MRVPLPTAVGSRTTQEATNAPEEEEVNYTHHTHDDHDAQTLGKKVVVAVADAGYYVAQRCCNAGVIDYARVTFVRNEPNLFTAA